MQLTVLALAAFVALATAKPTKREADHGDHHHHKREAEAEARADAEAEAVAGAAKDYKWRPWFEAARPFEAVDAQTLDSLITEMNTMN